MNGVPGTAKLRRSLPDGLCEMAGVVGVAGLVVVVILDFVDPHFDGITRGLQIARRFAILAVVVLAIWAVLEHSQYQSTLWLEGQCLLEVRRRIC